MSILQTQPNLAELFSFSAWKLYAYYIETGAAVKLCLGDLLVMGSNPETVSLHMQG